MYNSNAARSIDPNERLSQLIRLKQAEKPSPEFWSQFETELRNRRLTTLVIANPWYARLTRAALLLGRKAAPPAAAAAVATVAVVAVSSSGTLFVEVPDSIETEHANNQITAAPDQPLFVVSTESGHRPTTEIRIPDLLEPEIEANYQISVMAPVRNSETSFQLNAQPRTFSSPASIYSLPEQRTFDSGQSPRF